MISCDESVMYGERIAMHGYNFFYRTLFHFVRDSKKHKYWLRQTKYKEGLFINTTESLI